MTWSGRLVKECPLKVVVEPPSNASKVVCSGDGLRAGTLGKEIKCYIDTRSAGQDELTIKCEGPHGKKALSELNDHRDGRFTLYIRPQVSLVIYFIQLAVSCISDFNQIILFSRANIKFHILHYILKKRDIECDI